MDRDTVFLISLRSFSFLFFLIMGRVKLKIKKLESTGSRQVTYSKRRHGILKKARELAILCDIDILLLMFSPTGRPTLYQGERRYYLPRYINVGDSSFCNRHCFVIGNSENMNHRFISIILLPIFFQGPSICVVSYL